MVWSFVSARSTLDDSKLQAGGLRMRTLDHSGIFDAAGSEVHDSELRLHLKLGCGWGGVLFRPVSATAFRQQPYFSLADPESLPVPTPTTYQTDRTLALVSRELGGPL